MSFSGKRPVVICVTSSIMAKKIDYFANLNRS